ncbi:MAG: hypothetical protein [Arizlama microvirus]|nr:MAG: hypothetical protein [Arizlama microvirus]
MLEEQKARLKNRILLCENEQKLAKIRLRSNCQDLKFWKNEKNAAQYELAGMQMELNLRCSSCGD